MVGGEKKPHSISLWLPLLSYHCRFRKFLIFLGYPPHTAKEAKVAQVCKVITEFSLEYRTTREKLVQMREKKANKRERNKTRGKMIADVSRCRPFYQNCTQDTSECFEMRMRIDISLLKWPGISHTETMESGIKNSISTTLLSVHATKLVEGMC